MSYTRSVDGGGIVRAVVPSDTAFLNGAKALWSNAGGVVSLQFNDRKGDWEAPVSVTLPAGVVFPVLSPVRVRSTGTSASVLAFFEGE